eukprot:CAMPEP_0179069476 /NCGR_PEP_ID=MMETSP0796-20121207/30527_1 /TAXON_ID=73915 /ORGANISM="Pyrodinium bahamense, Strain pbaha01" /LENGTH=147 /DNA_ID=CAMNT_0020766543 /DNA_START=437 /DNA_END=877 /DNA_ORIENTATION=-
MALVGLPLALVTLPGGVEEDAEALLLVVDPRAIVLHPVLASLEDPVCAETVALVVKPVTLVLVPVWVLQRALTVLSVVRPLALVLHCLLAALVGLRPAHTCPVQQWRSFRSWACQTGHCQALSSKAIVVVVWPWAASGKLGVERCLE